MPSKFYKFSLFFHTVKNLSIKQIIYRAYYIGRRNFWKLIPQKVNFYSCETNRTIPIVFFDNGIEIQNAIDSAGKLSCNTFCFLNKEVAFGPEISWNDPCLSQLWRYHLHYFNYVQDLMFFGKNCKNDNRSAAIFYNLAKSWIDHNQIIRGDGWHPYTLSLRIVNWINALDYWRLYFDNHPDYERQITGSLYGQARFLASSLEKDVRGNHLIKNLKAMIWVGIKFQGREPGQWFARAINLLRQELDEQILPDSGHFERSPGYHLDVLKDVIDIAQWLRFNRKGVALCRIEEKLMQMLDFLRKIMTPDGNVPLIKDTTFSYALNPVVLLTGSTWKQGEIHSDSLLKKDVRLQNPKLKALHLRQSGFCILKDEHKRDFLIMNAGNPCPAYLPAHAHADMLSYELTIGGHKIITDSGVYEYCKGPWRDFFRSTRAHNTVEINGENQSEVWSSFRVGRRVKIGQVYFKDTSDYALIQAAHNGYRKRFGVTHRRTLVWVKKEFWLIIDDVYCQGRTVANNFVHFSPELHLNSKASDCWKIKNKSEKIWLTAFGHQDSVIVKGVKKPTLQGWHSERFGDLQTNNVLVFNVINQSDFSFGYGISQSASLTIKTTNKSNAKQVIHVTCKKSTFQINPQTKKVCQT